MTRVLIGTSGWQYDDWKGRFYPKDLPKTRWLEAFAAIFPTVEVNNSFYRLPEESAFTRWRAQTPRGFVVTVKANRFITHIKRMRESEDALELFWSRCLTLGDKLGPILFQFPPRFRADLERLRTFLELLPRGIRAAFEFRDDSWHTEEMFTLLDEAEAAHVVADWPDGHSPVRVCGGWSYVRFHKGSKMRSTYPRRKLAEWADTIAGLPAREVFVYFNNDPGGAAVRNAVTLTELLADRGADVSGPHSARYGSRLAS
jgi:uncharacterized protein YecE (DUF72 family)